VTTVEFHPYARVPGSVLAEVDIVLRPGSPGIAALRGAYFRGDILNVEAEWTDQWVFMPGMRVVLCLIRANGNVFHRLREVA